MINNCMLQQQTPAEQQGTPHYHNKDALVKNLKLLFANVRDVVIDDQGSLKSWIKEASDEKYWCKLIKYLLDKNVTIPERPAQWTRSLRNHVNVHREQPFPPTPPRANNNSNNDSNDTSNDMPSNPPKDTDENKENLQTQEERKTTF